MHRASLRKQLVKTCSPDSRAQPSPHLALFALFCQTSKSGQVNNKALALDDKGYRRTEALFGSSEKLARRLLPIQISKKCPPQEAKRKNHQATEPCYIHTPFATSRRHFLQVGKAAQRSALETRHRRWFLKLLTGET